MTAFNRRIVLPCGFAIARRLHGVRNRPADGLAQTGEMAVTWGVGGGTQTISTPPIWESEWVAA
jgi:hypothetical protein